MLQKKKYSHQRNKKEKKVKKITIIEDIEENPKKEINLGVQILRMIYTYLVCVVHFGSANRELYGFAWKYIDFYVTSFFLMAFYFSYNTFSSRNIVKIKERFWRLLIPYIFWPILVYVRNNFFKIIHREVDYSKLLKRFYLQYLVGNNVHGILWFLFNLIIFSLFICIIVLLFKDYHMIAIYILLIFGVIYNYTKIHHEFMIQFHRFPIQHSLEITNEVIIFASTGYILGHFNMLKVLIKLNKFIFIFFSPIFYIVKWHQEVFDYFPGFNVVFNTFFISSIFFFFGTLPFHLCNNKIKYFINIISQHTGGIYYVHTEINDILMNRYKIMEPRTGKSCLVIYFASFLFCFIGNKIFKNFRIRYLFN